MLFLIYGLIVARLFDKGSLMHAMISHEVYDLHRTAFYICCGIAISVFLALIYSLIKFRKSNDAKTVYFHKSLALEIFLASLPFVILVALALPTVKVFFKLL